MSIIESPLNQAIFNRERGFRTDYQRVTQQSGGESIIVPANGGQYIFEIPPGYYTFGEESYVNIQLQIPNVSVTPADYSGTGSSLYHVVHNVPGVPFIRDSLCQPKNNSSYIFDIKNQNRYNESTTYFDKKISDAHYNDEYDKYDNSNWTITQSTCLFNGIPKAPFSTKQRFFIISGRNYVSTGPDVFAPTAGTNLSRVVEYYVPFSLLFKDTYLGETKSWYCPETLLLKITFDSINRAFFIGSLGSATTVSSYNNEYESTTFATVYNPSQTSYTLSKVEFNIKRESNENIKKMLYDKTMAGTSFNCLNIATMFDAITGTNQVINTKLNNAYGRKLSHFYWIPYSSSSDPDKIFEHINDPSTRITRFYTQLEGKNLSDREYVLSNRDHYAEKKYNLKGSYIYNYDTYLTFFGDHIQFNNNDNLFKNQDIDEINFDDGLDLSSEKEIKEIITCASSQTIHHYKFAKVIKTITINSQGFFVI